MASVDSMDQLPTSTRTAPAIYGLTTSSIMVRLYQARYTKLINTFNKMPGKKINKLHIRNIKPANQFSKLQILTFASIFAVIGAVFIYSSFAAGPTSSLEAENSGVNSPATSVNDTNASGGRALKFQAGGSCALPKYPNGKRQLNC
jgi:hypothetical protein